MKSFSDHALADALRFFAISMPGTPAAPHRPAHRQGRWPRYSRRHQQERLNEAVAGDISTEETVAAVVAAAGGRFDALANVAGIMDNFARIHEVWTTTFGTASSGSTSPPS